MVRPFVPEDYAEICSWYGARGLTPPPSEFVPPTGFIVPGVAAGFVVHTDCNVVLVDGFISNPAAAPADRNAALDAIAGAMSAHLRARPMRAFFWTDDESIAQRASRWGFRFAGEAWLMSSDLPWV